MKILKWGRLLLRLLRGVIKFALKVFALFLILAMIFGVKVSFGITLIFIAMTGLVFINNLFIVLTEDVPIKQKRKKFKPYDVHENDHWVPGMPAISLKAYERGFFYEPHDD
ncbi:MAG: hypothetical protein OEY89_04025 [Gammaproteobacteria bacterium]|nr:hypothetical protein [Gammaproteobacteria bacterium]